MTLLITALDQQGLTRYFCCCCDSLEFALEALEAIALLGDLELEIDLIDNNQRMELPVECIDDIGAFNPLQQLEREWRLLFTDTEQAESVQFIPVNP